MGSDDELLHIADDARQGELNIKAGRDPDPPEAKPRADDGSVLSLAKTQGAQASLPAPRMSIFAETMQGVTALTQKCEGCQAMRQPERV